MTTILNEAMLFALKAHGDQMYGRKPYHVHLLDVVQVLRRFHDWDELPQDLVNAAWLHDVLEDTDVEHADVLEQFGRRVYEFVEAVTNAEGANRAERHAATYLKIRKCPGAIVLKLADRIANVEQCISHNRVGRYPGALFGMYSKEWGDFRSELYGKCAGESFISLAMWDHLTELIVEGRSRAILRGTELAE